MHKIMKELLLNDAIILALIWERYFIFLLPTLSYPHLSHSALRRSLFSSSNKCLLKYLPCGHCTSEYWDYHCCSVVQSRLTLCNPMNWSMPGFPVLHYLSEFARTHVHWVDDAIQPSHPLSPASSPALNLSQHKGLFQWVSCSYETLHSKGSKWW